MGKTQATIGIPTKYVSPVDVLGPKDIFLKAIKSDTDAKIAVNSDDSISIYGSEFEVERVTKLFSKLVDIAYTKEPVTLNEVGVLINQSHEGDFFEPQDDSVILKYGKKVIKARTTGQQEYLDSMRKNDITICISPAGAGKTMVAVCYALSLLVDKKVDRILITRPMVNARGENELGALPGGVEDKMNLFVLPLTDVFERVLGPEKLQSYMDSGKIKVIPLGYMRGISLKNTICLCDEFQCTNPTLAKLAVTRLGEASKIVIFGDPMQQDSLGVSGLTYLADSLEGIDGIGIVRMEESDIIRHPLIPKMIKAFDRYDGIIR